MLFALKDLGQTFFFLLVENKTEGKWSATKTKINELHLMTIMLLNIKYQDAN